MEGTESTKQLKECIGFMFLFESKYLFYVTVKLEEKKLKNQHAGKNKSTSDEAEEIAGFILKRILGYFLATPPSHTVLQSNGSLSALFES